MNKLPDIDPNQPIGLDVETCDPELKTLAPGFILKHGFLAGVAIAAKEGSFYIPVGHTTGENYDLKEVVAWLNKVCSADTDKIFHNAQYDLGWLHYVGVELHGHIFDTMLAAALLDENRRRYTLDAIGKIYLDEGKNEVALETAVQAKFGDVRTEKKLIRYKEELTNELKYQPYFDAKVRASQLYDIYPKEVQDKYEVVGKITSATGQTDYKLSLKKQDTVKGLLWAVDPSEMGSYPIQDVDLTYRLYHVFKKELAEQKLDKVMALENELLPCLLEMKEQGVRIDMKQAVELDKKYTKLVQEQQQALNKLAGFDVNVNAETDLVKLCEVLELTYKTTAKGNPCFDSENVPKHTAFDYILSIRKLNKCRDTYVRGYFFGLSVDGRLHGQYNQLKSDDGGTVTGRLSSSGPNLQNIPAKGEAGHEMRSLFIPDKDTEKWLCMDFSGQEPKMLVNLVLLLDRKFGGREVQNLSTGEITHYQEEGFPGASLARTEEFAGRKADFHTAVAKKCMEVENQYKNIKVTPDELAAQAKEFRPKAKSIGLGVMYGSGDEKVATEMTKKGFPMTKAEAGQLRASIYKGVPFLDAVNKYVMNIAKRRGYVMTLLKRRGRFDLWEIPIYGVPRGEYDPLLFHSMKEALEWTRSEEARNFVAKCAGQLGRPQRAFTYKALNKIIQGSSADQTKTAMVNIYKRGHDVSALDVYYRRTEFEPPKTRAQVHDELNFSIDDTEDISWFQDSMENSLPLLVKSVAEPGVGRNWSEAK